MTSDPRGTDMKLLTLGVRRSKINHGHRGPKLDLEAWGGIVFDHLGSSSCSRLDSILKHYVRHPVLTCRRPVQPFVCLV